MTNDLVTIYSDGACSASGSRAYCGGYAAILVFGEVEKVVSGGSYPETSQTSEMKAFILGLKQLKRPCQVSLFTDSEYLRGGITEWLDKWIARGWPRKVANQGLWKEIARQKKIHDISATWIRGHAPVGKRSVHQEYNCRCDELAVAEAIRIHREKMNEDK